MKIINLTCLACLLALLLAGSVVAFPAYAQGEGFQESFDDENLPGWEHSPQAEVVDGLLQVRPGGFALRFGEWTDITLEVKVRLPGPGQAVVGYYFRDADRYLLLLGDGMITLDRESGQTRSNLGSASFDAQPDAWLKLRIVVSGGEHQIYLNDILQLTATDPEALQGGGILLTVEREATAAFDDLVVSGLPGGGASPGEGVPSEGEPAAPPVGGEAVSPLATVPSTQAQPTSFLGEFFASQATQLELTTFLINLVLAAICSYILSLVYIHWGTSLSNRRKFASNFMLMTITTTFIILVVRSSVALSLGLVGALSIVRFRTAVKEPEELAHLFFAIGIGIGLGDNQRLITLIALAAGIVILGLMRLFRRPDADVNLHLTVASKDPEQVDIDGIMDALRPHVSKMKLLRFDENPDTLEAGFLVEFRKGTDLSRARDALKALSEKLEITFMDNKGIW